MKSSSFSTKEKSFFDSNTEKNYWNDFYKKFSEKKPSSFAKFIVDDSEYLENGSSILDVGCGNGRDTLYFFSKGFNVIGIDQSTEGILNSSKINKDIFFNANISNYNHMIDKYSDFNIYARFFLHAIPEEIEDCFFRFLSHLKPGCKIFFEFRTINDANLKKNTEEHYRRFINSSSIEKKVLSTGFRVLLSIEKNGLSKVENEDPILARIVAEKILK